MNKHLTQNDTFHSLDAAEAFGCTVINEGLLGVCDPAPVQLHRTKGAFPALLVCEHAGREIPAALGDLGLPEGERARHIAWDIGAASVALALSEALDAPLILQRYSRLVIDCNRPAHAPSLVPKVSDGTEVPGNTNISADQLAARVAAIHAPFHDAVAAHLDGRPVPVLAVHSFTPRLRAGGGPRPWHAGFLSRTAELSLGPMLITALRSMHPALELALNQPYQIDDDTDVTIPRHAEKRGLAHALVEIRQDLVDTPEGEARWANLLAGALRAALSRNEPA